MTIPKERRLCLFCKHFYFDPGMADISDITPGWDSTIECSKGYWKMNYLNTNKDFRGVQLIARTCQDWEADEDAERYLGESDD